MGWLYRKLLGGVRCLKENGFAYTIKRICEKVLLLFLPEGIYEISKLFLRLILPAYRVLAKLVRQHGDDALFLSCAIRGTGDYYLCGKYLDTWLKRNGIRNFVFLTPGGAQQKVTELFPIYQGHTAVISCEDEQRLRELCIYASACRRYYYHLDHQTLDLINGKQEIRTYWLMGYKGWTILSFYLEYGFHLTEEAPQEVPRFDRDPDRIDELFEQNGLIPGRTALLSPYSASQLPFLFPEGFWEDIAGRLREAGYTVCTNCAGTEKTVSGTVPLLVPYKTLVPFLDRAGVFIGIRSGLCDLMVTSTCKKVVLHTYKAMWWPDGNSISYTGLKKMGLCDELFEFVPDMEHMEDSVGRIMEYVL